MTGEEMKVICYECSEQITPYEYNSSDGEVWFSNGYLEGEMTIKCPCCGHHNLVSFLVKKIEIVEVK